MRAKCLTAIPGFVKVLLSLILLAGVWGVVSPAWAAGSIAGKVMDTMDRGVAGVTVRVFGTDGKEVAGAATAADGTYRIGGLSQGNYRIQFDASETEGGYYSQWYHGRETLDTADLVVVRDNAVTGGIDARLMASGTIEGRVVGPYYEGIEGVHVRIYNPNKKEAGLADTGADGRYKVTGLATGTYKVQFDPSDAEGNYVAQWYFDKTDFVSANAVGVISGRTTENIDVQLQSGGISGRVTDMSFQGIAGVHVMVYDLTHRLVSRAKTNSDGTYEIGSLNVGEYRVFFNASEAEGFHVSEWFQGRNDFWYADPVEVRKNELTEGIDARLAPGAAISGEATDASGRGIPGVHVKVYSLDNAMKVETVTNSLGNYVAKGIAEGDYKVYFDATRCEGTYASAWYREKESFGDADVVHAEVGRVTSGIDATLKSGAISGKVMDSDGRGIGGVQVVVFDGGHRAKGATGTDSEGNYTVTGLATGKYKILFDTSEAEGVYDAEWFDGRADFSAADEVNVTMGQITPNIDAALHGTRSEGAVILSLYPVDDAKLGKKCSLWAWVKNTETTSFNGYDYTWFYVDGPNWSGSHFVGYAWLGYLRAEASNWFHFDWEIPASAERGTYDYWARVYDYTTGSGVAISKWKGPQEFLITCRGTVRGDNVP